MRWTDTYRWASIFLARCLLFVLSAAAPLSALALPQQEPVQTQPTLPPRSSVAVQPQFLIVLDAAHGGTDSGAHLGAHLDEKDLVLALSIRLRSMLSARGIPVVTTRESDATLPPAQRAAMANAHKATACLILHASESGSGIHLFTSSLPPAQPATFLPWDQAQAAYLQQSLRWAAEINTAMTHAGVPVTLGRTAMQPLDNMTCPAAAVEIAPLTKEGAITAALTDPDYQSRILAGLTAAVESWRQDWKAQP
ncbi:MAG TPA: N-acetylmuramoyl-L-alanine amidase [Acidobacteriaceae bacterium]|nr:N-acetylmuramoyl-L-alanine amidase [Acidobacteriaceae bacterium]